MDDITGEFVIDGIGAVCGRGFFLFGLESIAQRLAGVQDFAVVIGNTTNRETLERLAEGYRRLELVAEAAEAEAYPKGADTKKMGKTTSSELRVRLPRPRMKIRRRINVLEKAFRGPITRGR